MNFCIVLRYSIYVLFFTVLSIVNIKAQTPGIQEKVVLITDRTNYSPGDTIWFSGYVLNAKEHTLVADEHILHVCFYDPNGDVEQHLLFPIKLGMCAGQIPVPELTKKGLYRIVAFTNYMLNWPDKTYCENQVWINGDKTSLNVDITYNWVNSKETSDTLLVNLRMRDTTDINASFYSISAKLRSADKIVEENSFLSVQDQSLLAIPVNKSRVSDTMQLEVTVVDDQSIVAKEIVIKKDSLVPDVQFLPESGILLSGIEQKIAFKAVDTYGQPIEVKGQVFDQNGNMSGEFASRYDGMGYFVMTPQAGVEYHAWVKYQDGRRHKYVLPQVYNSGAIISANKKSSQAQITVHTKGITGELKLLVHCRGSLVKIDQLPDEECTFTYDMNQFPAGIIHFTVVEAIKPICERILYNHPKTKLKVELPVENNVYDKRKEVFVPVSISGLSEKELAVYSFGVKDANYQHEYLESNIIVQTYIASELPGFVPNLKRLTNSKEASEELLDLLMLTTGWCRFSWKEVSESRSDAARYGKEEAVTMKGQIRNIISDKPLKSKVVKGEFVGEGGNLLKKNTTDDNGEFRFEFPGLVNDLNGTITVSREGGYKAKRVFATVETSTDIHEIDLSLIDPVASTVSKAPSKETYLSEGVNFDILPKNGIATSNKESKQRIDNYIFGNSDTVMLQGVNVIETKKENVRQRFRDMFGAPLKVLTNKQIVAVVKDMPWYTNTWDLISATIPELYFVRYPIECSYPNLTLKEIIEWNKLADESAKIDTNTLKYEFNYLYNGYIKGNKNRPVFIVLNGKRIHAHENPFLIPNDILVRNQNEQFRDIDPQQITSIELYDNINNVGGFESYYENYIAGFSGGSIFSNLITRDGSIAFAKPYIISINTKEGYNIWNTSDPKNFNMVIKGLTEMRVPYTPKYNKATNDSSAYDQRKTLFWSPLQLTKNNQLQNFKFYTGDKEGEKVIQINGITTGGVPFYAESSFTVEQKDSVTITDSDKEKTHKRIDKKTTINNREGVVLRCVDANDSPIPYLVIKSDQDKTIATNKDGEAYLSKRHGEVYDVSSTEFESESIVLSCMEEDTVTLKLSGKIHEKTDYLKSAEKLLASAINKSWQRMLSKPELSYFFREKVYKEGFLMSLEEWDLSCQLYSHGKHNNDNLVSFNKGKLYKIDDYFQNVKARPVAHGQFYPFSADPMYERKPFLEYHQMQQYNYTLVGERKQDTLTYYYVLFDVKADKYVPGYRGHILIDKNTTTIAEVSYEVSPVNKTFLDGSYFVHDNPEKLAIELTKTSFYAKYKVDDDKFYPLLLHEKIDFTSKGITSYCFEKEVLFDNELKDKKIARRLKSQTEMKISLVNYPLYDYGYFKNMTKIKLPVGDEKEIPFLHDIIEYK